MDTEKKELKRLQGLVKKAVDYRSKQRDHEYINNQATYEGLQWKLSEMGEDSPFIVRSDINHLANAIDIGLGSLYASSYYGILKPLSQDDVKAIENLQVVYKNEWLRLKADEITEDVIKSACIFDNGYAELNFDTEAIVGGTNTRREGAITLKHVATANIYLDPSADSIENCDYYVKRMGMTIEKIEREYPEWFKKLKENNIKAGVVKENDNGYIFAGRDYDQDNIIPIDVIYEKYKAEVGKGENKTKTTRIKIHYVCKDVLLETNEDYPFDEFPIIPLQWKKAPQTPYGIPLVRGLTVPQKVANLIESSINNIAVHYTVPSWLVSDDSGLDIDEVAQLINALGVVWKVTNVDTAIKQLEPPKLNKDMIAMGQTFVGYIREYAGVTGAYNGDIGTAGSTSSGTNEAIGRATIIDNDPMKQIASFVERLSRMIVKFMVRYYKDEMFSIREENKGQYSFKDIKLEESYSNINYEFDVDLGSRSKNDKNRQYNLMKEIYQLQNQYKDRTPVVNVTDVVKAAQLDNYNEMKTRLDNVSDESMAEKANLVVQLIQIGNTMKPDGQPLIDAETLQNGIMDVLNDDNDLSIAESIIKTYEEYETAITEMKYNVNNTQI